MDHRTDIWAYAQDVEQDMKALLALHRADGAVSSQHFPSLVSLGLREDYNDDPDIYGDSEADDLVAAYLLDVERTARLASDGTAESPEETRLTLTLGGPTVIVTYSHRYGTAELFHSWGRQPIECGGEDRTTWSLDPELVAEFIETFTPHPLEV